MLNGITWKGGWPPSTDPTADSIEPPPARRRSAGRPVCLPQPAFVDHAGELWPEGDDAATPEWIRENVDLILATLEKLYAAVVAGEHPGADAFLYRMRWLPPFLVNLAPRRLDG